jgi:hypothetical protein
MSGSSGSQWWLGSWGSWDLTEWRCLEWLMGRCFSYVPCNAISHTILVHVRCTVDIQTIKTKHISWYVKDGFVWIRDCILHQLTRLWIQYANNWQVLRLFQVTNLKPTVGFKFVKFEIWQFQQFHHIGHMNHWTPTHQLFHTSLFHQIPTSPCT